MHKTGCPQKTCTYPARHELESVFVVIVITDAKHCMHQFSVLVLHSSISNTALWRQNVTIACLQLCCSRDASFICPWP